jgi:hypothetical protein
LKAVSRQKPDTYVTLASMKTDYPQAFCEALDNALAAFPRKRPQVADEWLDVIVTQRSEADVIAFPHAHTHSPKGTGIYRSPGE